MKGPYEVMKCDRNPVLEEEDHPFQELLEPDKITSRANSGFDWEGLAAFIRGARGDEIRDK